MLLRYHLLILLATGHLWSAAPLVTLESGPISGTAEEAAGIHAYLGIPYAAPPVADLRWRAPQPVTGWTAPRACTAFSARCPQPAMLIGKDGTPQNEDCLYLNVWAPAQRQGPLPVLVWIHGGGWTTGSGSQDSYRGTRMAAAGAVVITINYRLGPFGFFAHPLLTQEAGTSGNYGLLDIIAALEWVQRNGAAFGGDPQRVTIFGESAGAGCVARLLLMPKARGLFHRAIIQSGGVSGFNPHLRKVHGGVEAAETVGTRIAEDLIPAGSEDVLAALRAVPAERLLAASNPQLGLFRAGGTSFAPVVDGVLIPEDPNVMMKHGLALDVPVLIGANADEATIFTTTLPLRNEVDLRRLLAPSAGRHTEALLRLFPIVDGDVRTTANALIGITAFVAEARRLARTLSGPQRSPVWLYHFSRVPPMLGGKSLGAFHSAEIAYVFGWPEIYAPRRGITAIDRRLSEAMLGAWVRFAATGNPNGDGLPAWPAYTAESDTCLEFGDMLVPRTGLHREACDLADVIYGERVQ